MRLEVSPWPSMVHVSGFDLGNGCLIANGPITVEAGRARRHGIFR